MTAAAKLIELLGNEFDKRLPAGLSEADREAGIVELLAEDPHLNEMATRLMRLLGNGPEAPGGPDE